MKILLICALSVLTFSLAGCKKPAAPDIQGAWEGSLQAGELALRLVLKISRAADGSYTATADSIDQGMRDIPARETDLQGYWKGAIQVKDNKLRLALKIAKLADGSFRGTMDSVDQGARNIPMSSISYTNPVVHLDWNALGASYHGELAAGKMTGTYQQLRQSFPLTFTRTNSP